MFLHLSTKRLIIVKIRKFLSFILYPLSFFLLTLSFLLLPLSFSIAQENKYQPAGPFNIRNQMPLYIYFMAPTPGRAQTLGKGRIRVDASYHVSNVISQQRPWPAQQFTGTDGSVDSQRNREWYVYIDTEVNRLDLNLSYGILDDLEFTVDIPYFIFSDGYLDGFIENFEDAFTFIKTPNARDERERDTYQYEIRNRGRPIIFTTSHPNDFGEVSAYLKYRFLKEGRYLPAASLRGAVKFPTTRDELLGSKKFDYGISLMFDKNIFKKLFLYSNLSWVFIERPDILADLDVFKTDMVHGMLGFEYFLTDKTSMLFQATANSTLYDGGVTSTGRDPVVLTLGFNHNFNERVAWQFAVNENTNTAAPDFGVFTGVKVKI